MASLKSLPSVGSFWTAQNGNSRDRMPLDSAMREISAHLNCFQVRTCILLLAICFTGSFGSSIYLAGIFCALWPNMRRVFAFFLTFQVGLVPMQVSAIAPGSCAVKLSKISFQFPEGTSFKDVDLSEFDNKQIGSSAAREFYANLNLLLAGHLSRPKTVLYVGSGIDGALTHELFPHADLHISVDPLELFYGQEIDEIKNIAELIMPKEKLIETFLMPFVNGGASGFRDMGKQLFTVFIRHLPHGSRILQVQLAILPGQTKHPHLVIAYDFGPKTTVQWHVHIVDEFPSNLNSVKLPWWFEQLQRLRPDAFVTKAYLGIFNPDVVQVVQSWTDASENGIIIADAYSKLSFTQSGVSGRFFPFFWRYGTFGHSGGEGAGVWIHHAPE